jgi:hypothetical protein
MQNINKTLLGNNILNCLWRNRKPNVNIATSAHIFMSESTVIGFSKKEFKYYFDAKTQIYEYPKFNRSYSKNVLSKKFDSFISTLYLKYKSEPTLSQIKEKINEWNDELERENELDFKFYFILQNINISRILKFGKIQLELNNEKNIKILQKELISRTENNSALSDENKIFYKNKVILPFIEQLGPFNSSVIVTVSLRLKDEKLGYQIAVELIQEMVNIFHYFKSFIRGDMGHVGLNNEVGTGMRHYLALSKKNSIMSSSRVTFPFQLTTNNLNSIRKVGFNYFGTLFGKDRCEIENKLINAITWAGKANVEVNENTKFLYYVISLESLLLNSGTHSISSTFAERLAFLLGQNPTRRKNINSLAKRIYQIRNKIVHEGIPESYDDLIEMLPIAHKYCIRAIDTIRILIIKKNWENFSDLEDFFVKEKFGQ